MSLLKDYKYNTLYCGQKYNKATSKLEEFMHIKMHIFNRNMFNILNITTRDGVRDLYISRSRHEYGETHHQIEKAYINILTEFEDIREELYDEYVKIINMQIREHKSILLRSVICTDVINIIVDYLRGELYDEYNNIIIESKIEVLHKCKMCNDLVSLILKY